MKVSSTAASMPMEGSSLTRSTGRLVSLSTLRTLWLMATFTVLAFVAGCSSGSHAQRRLGEIDVHTFERDSTNVYVLARGTSLVMIDSGYERNAAALDHAMRTAGLDPSHVRAVVLTHGHADHAGGARYFQQHYGARVIAGRGDEGMLSTGHNEALCPTGVLGSLRHGTDQGATYTPVTPDVLVDEPLDLASVAGIDARVIPLPGHTHGSLVAVIAGAAFVGDLFRGSLVGSGAEVHLYMCDVPHNRIDIQHLLNDLAPGATVFFPGHFGALDRSRVVDRFGH